MTTRARATRLSPPPTIHCRTITVNRFHFPLYLPRLSVIIYLLVAPIQPTIIPRSEHAISRKWISPNAVRVLYKLKEHGYFAYLVGGGVRDLLLGREPKDFDIATDATPNEIKKIFRNCRLIGRRFRLAHIHFHDEIIEVATFRSSSVDESPAEAAAQVEAQVEVEKAAPAPPPGEAASAATRTVTAPAPRPRPPRLLKNWDSMFLPDNVCGTHERNALMQDF